MKIKFFHMIFLLILTIGLSNCRKNCDDKIVTCSETPPSEACQAYFNRWFYNKDKNKCEQVSYSGCSQKGFETKEACDECECN